MEFSNLAARLLLGRFWKEQNLVPLDPPRSWMLLLRLLGRTVLRADRGGIEIRAPIFIICPPRSGSTMLHQLLACHERVAYITATMDQFGDPTVFYAAEWLRRRLDLNVRGERYLGDSVQVDATTPTEGMRFWADLLERDPFDLSWPERRRSDLAPDAIERAKAYIRHVIHCFRERGADRFLNKSPALVTEVRVLQEIFPDARFVHLVRDGRLVANSMIKLYRRQAAQDVRMGHPLFKDRPLIPYPRVARLAQYVEQWGPEDLRTTAHVWNDCLSFIHGLEEELTHFHEVRFEDLLANPREALDRIFVFCDLPPVVACRKRFDEKVSGIGKTAHQNRYGGFEIVEEVAGENLRRYGYR